VKQVDRSYNFDIVLEQSDSFEDLFLCLVVVPKPFINKDN
jgi:hypothetical protein